MNRKLESSISLISNRIFLNVKRKPSRKKQCSILALNTFRRFAMYKHSHFLTVDIVTNNCYRELLFFLEIL